MLLAGCPGKKRCEKRCEDAADTELAKSEVIQTGHICFFQLAVCFWVLGLPLFCNGVVNALKTSESVMFWRLPWEASVERRQAGDMLGSFNLRCHHMPTELAALNMRSSLVSTFFKN